MDTPTPTETAVQTDGGYLTVAQINEAAKTDLAETDVTDVFGGGKVRIRALTAAQSAHVKSASITIGGARRGQGADYNWAAAELLNFRYGVINPKFNDDEVKTLHLTAGPSFQKILKEIDKLSGTDEESVEKDEAAFPRPGE